MNKAQREEARITLARYLDFFPEETQKLEGLQALLTNELEDPFSRSNPVGHVTTSAVVLPPELDHVLMIHHRFLKRWLPPGGHYEAPGTLWDSATREVLEETGVGGLRPWSLSASSVSSLLIPLRIWSHRVPPRPAKEEGPHVHHDFRYLAVAERREDPVAQLEEVHEVRWVPLKEFAERPEPDMQELYRKLKRALAA